MPSADGTHVQFAYTPDQIHFGECFAGVYTPSCTTYIDTWYPGAEEPECTTEWYPGTEGWEETEPAYTTEWYPTETTTAIISVIVTNEVTDENFGTEEPEYTTVATEATTTAASADPDTPELPEGFVYGDANGDGKIDLNDVTLILQHIAGWNVCLGPQA